MSCKKWKLSPFKDPETNKKISEKRMSEMKKKCKSEDYNNEDCIFFNLTSLNPKTMRKISSPASKRKIENLCKKSNRKQLTLEEVCKKWTKEPLVNPRTNRKLSGEKSQVYQKLKKECENFKKQSKKSKPKKSKSEERMERELIPYKKVEKKIKELEKKLEKCSTEQQLDNWELEFDKIAEKRRNLFANTLELDEEKKKLQKKIVKLYQKFEKAVYQLEKKSRKK
jgi:hypothetical protein